MTVLVSSHILSEIEQVSTHVGIINKGVLCFQGTITELMKLGKEEIKVVAKPINKACDRLKILGYDAKVDGDKILLSKVNDIPKLNKELVNNDIDIYHLSQDKESLEEIFINIIKSERVNYD